MEKTLLEDNIGNALRWIDGRISVIKSERRIRTYGGIDLIWDLQEIGRRLATNPTICKKYDGKWNSDVAICEKNSG